ncbi:MAG: hypothetical protein Q4P31_06175 [Andreesenia angusta]|nr:hypothetical protein [Andreesenia angusta]
MDINLGIIFLCLSILFILVTDYMVKKGRILEVRTILITKVIGLILLFISIGFLIVKL